MQVWLNNSDGYYSDIYGTDINLNTEEDIITAKFNLPANTHQGLWNVYIANLNDGVFYRNSLLTIGQNLSVKEYDKPGNINLKVFPNPLTDAMSIEYRL